MSVRLAEAKLNREVALADQERGVGLDPERLTSVLSELVVQSQTDR